MNYRWPTRASLGQALDQQLSDSMVGETEVTLTPTQSAGDPSCVTTRGDGERGGSGISGGYDARSSLSSAQTNRDFETDWSTTRNSGGPGGETSSTRPFHIFRGKKAHQIIPVQDSFIPPRHLAQPMTKNGLISMHALAAAACLAEDTPARPGLGRSAVAAPSGLCKAAHLPPMAETPRDGRRTAGSEDSGTVKATSRRSVLLQKRPFREETLPQVSSFERKLAARRNQWSREAEADAEERAFQEQWRTQELLRHFNDRGGGGKAGESCLRNGNSRSTRNRRTRSRDWRDCDDGFGDETKASELIPEREEQLLTEMFRMLDARNRGEVRLDEMLFYMTENAKVGETKTVPLSRASEQTLLNSPSEIRKLDNSINKYFQVQRT